MSGLGYQHISTLLTAYRIRTASSPLLVRSYNGQSEGVCSISVISTWLAFCEEQQGGSEPQMPAWTTSSMLTPT